MSAPLSAFDLGLVPYLQAQELQARLRSAVAAGRSPGVLLLLEHPPVITFGSRGGPQDLRMPPAMTTIPVMRSERGGQATLHAPGQLVSYPILPIPGRDLRRYVTNLEEVLILVLHDHGIDAARRQGRPGLYVRRDKIASIGLRCERWIASHGTSLNVDLDLRLFDAIVSCGEAELRQTSMAVLLGAPPPMAEVKLRYRRRFGEVFGRHLAPLRVTDAAAVEAALGLRS